MRSLVRSGLKHTAVAAAASLAFAGLAVVGQVSTDRTLVEAQRDVIRSSAAGADDAPETRLTRLAVPQVDPAALQRSATAEGGRLVAALNQRATKAYSLLGVTWQSGTPDGDLRVDYRVRSEGSWTTWQPLEVDEATSAGEPGGRDGTIPAWVGDADGVAVRVFSESGAKPADLDVLLIDGGDGLATDTTEPAAPSAEETVSLMASSTTEAGFGEPTIVSRAEWGADDSKGSSCSAPVTAGTMKGVVLHHTAGSNDYTAEEAAGVVRGIHSFHTDGRGWCDIGYNFLVDKYGVIYEGRRGGIYNQVRGAHAGNWDVNLYTTGISMLGNFEEAPLTSPLKNAVVRLIAWRLWLFNRGAFGPIAFGDSKIPRISGHRDVYASGIRPATGTACPGAFAADWLSGGLRNQVKALLDQAPASPKPTPSPTPTPTPSPSAGPTPTPSVSPTPTPIPTVAPTPVTSRLAGRDRYSTAAAISAGNFAASVQVVFLASGELFSDALSAGPAAARKGSPVLLTGKDSISKETREELTRLSPARIFVVGGPATVSDNVLAQAKQYADSVVRLSGRSRYSTGVATSRRFWKGSDVVYVSSGLKYTDALSGGALAALQGAPMLLSEPEQLPDEVAAELTRLAPSRVVVLGGALTVGESVVSQIRKQLPGVRVSRIAGKDRYDVSAAIAREGWDDAEHVFFAAGTVFTDALAGVSAAAQRGAPLVLTEPTCMPSSVAAATQTLAPLKKLLLGGPLTLSDNAISTTCTN